jgi:hypothetical protein
MATVDEVLMLHIVAGCVLQVQCRACAVSDCRQSVAGADRALPQAGCGGQEPCGGSKRAGQRSAPYAQCEGLDRLFGGKLEPAVAASVLVSAVRLVHNMRGLLGGPDLSSRWQQACWLAPCTLNIM